MNDLSRYRDPARRAAVFAMVDRHRTEQEDKWGERTTMPVPDVNPLLKLAILAEEFGEVANAVLEHDDVNLVEELVQVAACCVAWIEAMQP